MRLEGKVAIITGAGRNIGEAVGHLFADEGAKVALIDIRLDAVDKVAAAINERHKGAAIAIQCDVSSASEVQDMVSTTVASFGGIDILVNNAAITDHTPALDLPEEEWDRILAVTLKSVFLTCKYVGHCLRDQGRGGKIINIASTSGHRGRADATAYSAAKGGLLNLTRSLAIQFAEFGVRVNSLTPNRIGSPVGKEEVPSEGRGITNLVGRPGVPLDIANAAIFLASDEADFIAAADILVDGGSLAGALQTPFSPK